MRAGVVFLVVVAACSSNASDHKVGTMPASECAAANDCVASAAKCCDCPTFAVPVSDPSYRACVGERCPTRSQCPRNVRATCDQGRCVLTCVAMECRQSCPDGFETDANNCLTCECAAVVAGGCTQNSDCVRVRADCCGCRHGGQDTAVLWWEAAAFDAHLKCGAAPRCPTVATCNDGAAPRCIQGRCELTTAGQLPSNACGRWDLPPCPQGEDCVVNGSNATANQEGVGVCTRGG